MCLDKCTEGLENTTFCDLCPKLPFHLPESNECNSKCIYAYYFIVLIILPYIYLMKRMKRLQKTHHKGKKTHYLINSNCPPSKKPPKV